MTVNTVQNQELKSNLLPILERYRGKRGAVIGVLQEAQRAFGYLPREVLIFIANELSVPLAEIYSVASFYSQFSTVPVGRHRLEVCTGTACYVKGSHQLLEKLREKLALEPGQVSENGRFSLSTTRCVGACSAAPVLKIGEELYGEFTVEKIDRLLEQLSRQDDPGYIRQGSPESTR